MQFSQLSELPQQAVMPHTGENLFSSTALLQNNSDSLPRPLLAIRAVGRAPGLPTKRSRKARRVLYPARVRKYLPRPKKDVAKRWLLVCAGIVLLQVLTEEPEREGLAGGKAPKEQLCTLHAQLRAAHLGAAQLGAAENCSREDRAAPEAPAIILSSAYGQPLVQTRDVPRQAGRQLHAFCRQCLAGLSHAEH
uniref:Uncharacterized protein n=1 Tax=Pavo cristatus TaxID=9049 RepID=A0A8C9ESR5_PAVCR